MLCEYASVWGQVSFRWSGRRATAITVYIGAKRSSTATKDSECGIFHQKRYEMNWKNLECIRYRRRNK